MRKIRVVVLMGGKSPEYEVSIISGTNVTLNLDSKKYEVLPVVISKDGAKWRLTSRESLLTISDPLKLRGTRKEIILSREKRIDGANSFSDRKIDVVFVAMHGPYGEDGTIQGMLELTGIPYTGSGVGASAVGMDKIMFRKIMKAEGIRIPKYVVTKRGEGVKNIIKTLGKPPYFVKPVDQGSSVGSSIVRKGADLAKALRLAYKFGKLALVDQYLVGTEVTCAVIGNDDPIALPVIEIVPLKGEFFDYESKYSESGAEEIVPAKISKALARKIQDLSIKIYKAIGCRGFARIDFILKNNRVPVVLEINTIPGLTPMSLLPKAAKAAGISYAELINRIIEFAL